MSHSPNLVRHDVIARFEFQIVLIHQRYLLLKFLIFAFFAIVESAVLLIKLLLGLLADGGGFVHAGNALVLISIETPARQV